MKTNGIDIQNYITGLNRNKPFKGTTAIFYKKALTRAQQLTTAHWILQSPACTQGCEEDLQTICRCTGFYNYRQLHTQD